MKRLLLLTAAGLAVVALAGAVGLPDLAGAQDATADRGHRHRLWRRLRGSGAERGADVVRRGDAGATAKAAVAANADAMRKVINALRQAGAREIATQWVSVYPVNGENGAVEGYSASNSVSAVSGIVGAAGLIDAAVEAGANQVSGPGMSSSNAEELYRQALANAVDEARERAQVLAKAAGRSLGEIDVDRRGLRRRAPPVRRARSARRVDADRPRPAGDDGDRDDHLLPPLSRTGGRRQARPGGARLADRQVSAGASRPG